MKTNPALVGGLFLLTLLLGHCANYRLHQADPGPKSEPPFPADRQPAHRVFLVGDPGIDGRPPAAFQLLEERLAVAGPNSTVLFLGNQTPGGFPDAADPKGQAMAHRALDRIVELLQDYPGQYVFLPGHRDWMTGVDGLQRQRDYLERALGRDDLWEPKAGCAGPEEIDLTEEVVLILFDSQWWVGDWSDEPEINEACAAKSRSSFRLLMEDAIKGNREKTMLVAMHHPLFSYGPRGGSFSARQHLFPLTDIQDNLYLPLPGLGSLYPFYKAALGSRQDLAHPRQRSLREALLNIARPNGSLIFAAGHEGALQHIRQDEQDIIVSGSAARATPSSRGTGTQFGYSRPGFAQLDFFEDGSAWLHFWAVAEGMEANGRRVYTRQLKPPSQQSPDRTVYPREGMPASVVKPLSAEVIRRTGMGRFLWGRHYRDAYLEPLALPNLRLDTFQQGVIPIKMGGGYQTNSLRLENQDGRQYTMRSIDKDPSRTVPYPLNRSQFLLRIVEDAFNASHPTAALAIPPLAGAAGVYHTHPSIYHVPEQAYLGGYNSAFADAVYLVEERPDDEVWKEEVSFGRPDDIVSTADVIEEIHEHSDHKVDYRAVVRARLFDLVLGDWDRHDDQWRWSVFEAGDSTMYRPIPRDRDQAFSHYDGLLYHFVRQSGPAARPLRPFQAEPRKIKWSNYGSRHFDPTFLDPAPWSVWAEEIERLQGALGDSLIERTFRARWPAELYGLDGEEVVRKLKARRNALPRYAREFFLICNRTVDVVGTQSRDLFLVERLDDERTRVSVYDTNRNGEREAMLYSRIFRTNETRNIHLYGLADDDIFQLTGSVRRGPRVRIIAGTDEDKVDDASAVGGLSKKTWLYDARSEDLQLQHGRELRARRSADPRLNTYNRRSSDYEFNFSSFLPVLGYNPDDGLLLGLMGTFTTYGFKREPFATQHRLKLAYATASSGLSAAYTGDFIDLFPEVDLRVSGAIRTPLYTYNFYGLSNDSPNLEDSLGTDYHRVRQRFIGLAPALLRRFHEASSLSFGPSYESYRVDLTGDRFIDEVAPGLDPEIFEGKSFLGLFTRYRLSNLDDPLFPRHGLEFDALLAWRMNVRDPDQHFGYLRGHLALYQQLIPNGRLVVATRFGGQHIFNNRFDFYQGATLGGMGPDSNFRGFRRERFTGRTAFYHNTDLRWDAADLDNNLLPLTIGFFAGFDHGRVWVEGETSDTWHYSYGGGFWLSPLSLVDLMFSWFRGDEETSRFTFSGRFFF